jgi:hypothetical protein
MDEEQRKSKWNEVRARRGGVPVVPDDVNECHTTCDNSDSCYINGCQEEVHAIIEPASRRRNNER